MGTVHKIVTSKVYWYACGLSGSLELHFLQSTIQIIDPECTTKTTGCSVFGVAREGQE